VSQAVDESAGRHGTRASVVIEVDACKMAVHMGLGASPLPSSLK